MKRRRWFWYFPGDAYALGPTEARSERHSRELARQWEGVARLPRGFATWME